MKVHRKTPRVVLTNLLVATAISLIVNFFYLITFITTSYSNSPAQHMRWHEPQMIWGYVGLQILYFMLMAFVLVTIATTRLRNGKVPAGFILKIFICIAIVAVFYFLAPKMNRAGEIIMNFQRRRMLDGMLVLQCSLTLVVALLYGKIFDLVYQRQNILLENEMLKNENLQATYNSLVNQINPHFFFNSLNSLAMLVREKHNEKALDYIDRLSDSFRYILQNGQADMKTLDEELKFLAAYTYMLDIRYEGKIFFVTEIDPSRMKWRLPALSLQTLIENAVKHNAMTRSKPLNVSIHTHGDRLVVSNPVRPKIEKENGAGIGIENLRARYLLLTGQKITVANDGRLFEVSLPLIPPEE